MIEIISSAIRQYNLLQYSYKGATRIVEPHLLGVSKANNICLSAFQLSGGSGISFRQFNIDEISSLVVLDEKFSGSRPGFNPADPSFVRVIESL